MNIKDKIKLIVDALEDIKAQDIAEAVLTIAADGKARQRMSAAGRTLIDGDGAARVVAEGVETLDQSEQLAAMDCEFVQGFQFSRPVDAATVWAKLLRHG